MAITLREFGRARGADEARETWLSDVRADDVTPGEIRSARMETLEQQWRQSGEKLASFGRQHHLVHLGTLSRLDDLEDRPMFAWRGLDDCRRHFEEASFLPGSRCAAVLSIPVNLRIAAAPGLAAFVHREDAVPGSLSLLRSWCLEQGLDGLLASDTGAIFLASPKTTTKIAGFLLAEELGEICPM